MGRGKISASMMCSNFLDIRRDLDAFAEHGVDYLHIDVMDGHYVPNFTLGVDFCRALASHSKIPLDVHLMIENVDAYIPQFAQFPGAVVCIHPEVSYHPIRSLQLIRSLGARAGIALDPAVPLDRFRHLIPEVDLVCVMTVNPGYAGQKLIPQTLGKIAEAAQLIRREGRDVELEADGNVSWENIPRMTAAGAGVLVAGTSSLFDGKADLGTNLRRMRALMGAES
jgi:ribulose-phosphate 3-epimerase